MKSFRAEIWLCVLVWLVLRGRPAAAGQPRRAQQWRGPAADLHPSQRPPAPTVAPLQQQERQQLQEEREQQQEQGVGDQSGSAMSASSSSSSSSSSAASAISERGSAGATSMCMSRGGCNQGPVPGARRRQLAANETSSSAHSDSADRFNDAKVGNISHPTEALLWEKLMDGYDANVMPWLHLGGPVDVEMQLAIQKIMDVDLVQGQLSVLVWWRLMWTDPRLTWDPAEWDGIEFLPTDNPSYQDEKLSIWQPEVVMWNEAIRTSDTLHMHPTHLSYDGRILWTRHGVITAACNIQGIRGFPYKDLSCMMEFGDWTYSPRYVQLYPVKTTTPGVSIGGSETSLSNATTDTYTLKSVTCTRHLYEPYPCCPDERWPVLWYEFTFAHSETLYTVKIILSQALLCIIGFTAFWLSPACGERIGLTITIPLAAAVYDLLVFEQLPNSNTISFISLFGLISFTTSMLVALETAIVIQLHYHDEAKWSTLYGFADAWQQYKEQRDWIKLLVYLEERLRQRDAGHHRWRDKAVEVLHKEKWFPAMFQAGKGNSASNGGVGVGGSGTSSASKGVLEPQGSASPLVFNAAEATVGVPSRASSSLSGRYAAAAAAVASAASDGRASTSSDGGGGDSRMQQQQQQQRQRESVAPTLAAPSDDATVAIAMQRSFRGRRRMFSRRRSGINSGGNDGGVSTRAMGVIGGIGSISFNPARRKEAGGKLDQEAKQALDEALLCGSRERLRQLLQDILDSDASGMRPLQRAILRSLKRFDLEHLVTRLMGVLSPPSGDGAAPDGGGGDEASGRGGGGGGRALRRGDMDDWEWSANAGPDPRSFRDMLAPEYNRRWRLAGRMVDLVSRWVFPLGYALAILIICLVDLT